MSNADVKKAIRDLVSHLGDWHPAVRYRAPSGSIANNDPAQTIRRPCWRSAPREDQQARDRGEDFFKACSRRRWRTARSSHSRVPIPAKAGYSKMRHPASRFALTGVFVVKTKRAMFASRPPRVAERRAAVPAIEAALKANWSAAALDGVKISGDGMLSDIHGRRPIAPIRQGDGAACGDRGR